MALDTGAVVAYAGVTEAALALGHRTYAGTVASTGRQPSPVESFTSVSAARTPERRDTPYAE